jgi:hypothetical protein
MIYLTCKDLQGAAGKAALLFWGKHSKKRTLSSKKASSQSLSEFWKKNAQES